jgi:hypothetical protein
MGPGFDVSSARGAVEVPGEEKEPSAALQLADVRMYAQKESRRVASDAAIEIDGAEVEVRLRSARDDEALEQSKQDRRDLGPTGGVR